jgi:nucleolar pre-ribosomal-associated protein 2
MLVRWLLKNMNGASDDAERLRRYPLTWRILGRVFSSIPLFSLAKSLADRRFVVILQNTLKDASEPQVGSVQVESSDTEMADAGSEDAPRPSKRKRSDRMTFDIASQRSLDGCLRTAETLFEAIRLLLVRLESDAPKNAKRENHMGVEHIKSLFRSSASDIKDLILPAFNVCKLAVENADKVELRDGQESWISTICSIWDLHLQGEADAFQVATYLSPPTVHMLGRLTDIPFKSCAIDMELGNRWTQDVRRFLTRNLILPTRTAFLNRGSIENIRLMVDLTLGFTTMSCPVIFDLVLSSPQLSGGQSSKRDNDSWVQAVFSLLDETLRSSKSKHKLVAVTHMMNNICEHGVTLSLESLRSFCNNYALQPKQVEWRLLLLVAKINPDTFIVGEGGGLLRAILGRTELEDAWGPMETDLLTAQEFIIALAEGYARARDLSGFVKLWFDGLCSTKQAITNISSTKSPHYHLWLNEKLCTTVAESLEKTMNTKQILTLLDWLDLQAEEDSILKGACVTLILSAVSGGITQDDVIDSVGTRLVDTVFAVHSPARCSDHVLASRWIVARRSLAWATSAQREHIWTVASPRLGELLKSIVQCDTSDYKLVSFRGATKFALAAWRADHPGGTHEKPAAEMTSELMSQLDGILVTYQDHGLFFDDLVADCPSLFR